MLNTSTDSTDIVAKAKEMAAGIASGETLSPVALNKMLLDLTDEIAKRDRAANSETGAKRQPIQILADNNPNNAWGQSIVEVVLKAWTFEKTFVLKVGGNCHGFDVIDGAICQIYDYVIEQPRQEITLTNPKGELLRVTDDDDRGEYWIKNMVVSARIIDYIQPTLNEVRAKNGAAPVPNGDRPYEPLVHDKT